MMRLEKEIMNEEFKNINTIPINNKIEMETLDTNLKKPNTLDTKIDDKTKNMNKNLKIEEEGIIPHKSAYTEEEDDDIASTLQMLMN